MCPEKTDGYTAVPRFFLSGQEAQLNGLTLAFIGDAVYGLMAREYALRRSAASPQTLHARAAALSNASFQSLAAERLAPLLTPEETEIFKRGRNARPGHVPKNKSQAEYHRSTGLEALFGWLYLRGESGRIQTLFLAAVGEGDENG